jgi:hypothetical protein
LQIDGFGRERKSVFERRNGLVEASDFAKLAGGFEKCRWKRRSPRPVAANAVASRVSIAA